MQYLLSGPSRRFLPAVFACCILAGMAAVALAAAIKEVEITRDPPRNGQQIFTFRFCPNLTRQYDKLVFDCYYQQEVPWETLNVTGQLKVIEPQPFTYTTKNVSMVEELDKHISFRIPVDRERLDEMYGKTTFNTGFPVNIVRFRITGTSEGKTDWQLELPSEGTFVIETLAASTNRPTPGTPVATNVPPAKKAGIK